MIERAYQAAFRFDPEASIRVFSRNGAIETGFVHEGEPDDEKIEVEGIAIFVAKGLEGTLDVTAQHDHLILR